MSLNICILGLREAVLNGIKKTPIRFIIVDDSGSMVTNDGHRLVGVGTNTRSVSCSRWTELIDAMKFHAGLAEGTIPNVS